MSALSKLTCPESRLYHTLMAWRWIPKILVVASAIVMILMTADRAPPFQVLSYTTTPAKPGGVMTISAEVRRATDRNCSVELSSFIFDSEGSRWEYGGMQMSTPQGIRDIDASSPGRIARKIVLPKEMAVGPAMVKSSMLYRCNIMQELLRPIYVQTEFKFEVLP